MADALLPRSIPNDRRRSDVVVYFFSKPNQSVRCVLDVVEPGGPFRITLIAPDGTEHVQVYPSARDAETRWNDMQRALLNEGWEGPLGIDPRS
jgi:hypothetical protein